MRVGVDGMTLASVDEAMDITESIASDKKLAEYYLLNYEAELQRYKEAKEEYMTYKPEQDDNVGGGKSNVTGNPTEQAVLKGMQFDGQYEGYKWLKAVEIVQRGLGERKNIFIRVRREAERQNIYTIGRGRKGWVLFVQRRYAEEIERRFIVPEVYIPERTIRKWWNDIIIQSIFVQNKI